MDLFLNDKIEHASFSNFFKNPELEVHNPYGNFDESK